MMRLFKISVVFVITASILCLFSAAMAKSEKNPGKKRQIAADALFTNANILHLRIEIPKEGLKSLRNDPRKYVKAVLWEGGQAYTNIMVHVKGSVGSYRDIDDKPGLTFSLNKTDSKERFHGLKKFHLNNSVQDGTYLSEWTCSELFRQAGVPAPRATHALVELNGRKLGLYVLVESINQDFLETYSFNTKGNVYGQPGGADITEPLERMEGDGENSRQDLKALAKAAHESDPARLAKQLPLILDVDCFISFMALEVMLCHWDGYTFAAHNYRVYHDMDTDKMVFIPHDLDQLMADSSAPILPNPNGLVSRAILNLPQTRLKYQQRFKELFKTVFVATNLTTRIDTLVVKLMPALKTYDAHLAREFKNNAENLKDRIKNRAHEVEKQLNQPVPEPLKFANNIAKLEGWRRENDEGGAMMEKVDDPNGKQALWIRARGATTASWRTRVLLERGRYSFEGMARSSKIKPVFDDLRGEGAGLRISGNITPRRNKLTGDSNWQKLTFNFEIKEAMEEIGLVAELRATEGETWFDVESLQLVQLK